MNGIVKWFHPQKGFGYIERVDGRKVLFRLGDLQFGGTGLQKGDEVEFEIDDGRLVPRARQVVRLGQRREVA